MKRKRKQVTILDYFRNNVKWFMMFVAAIFIAGIFIGPGFGSYGHLQCGEDPSNPANRQKYLEDTSDVMARLDDKEFRAFSINRTVNEQLDSYRQSNPSGFIPPEQLIAFTWSILDRQITEELKTRKAKEMNIEVTAKEVTDEYEKEKKSMIERMGIIPASSAGNESLLQKADRSVQEKKAERGFLAQLAAVNMTPDSLKEMIRKNLTLQKYDEKLTEEAKKQVMDEAKKKSIGIYNRIVTDGEDFATVAKTDSDEISSAEKGGLVENLTRKEAKEKSPEYATALFTDEIGKVKEPLEQESGLYIIKVESRMLAEGPEYEKAKPGIVEQIKKDLGIKDETATETPKDVKQYSEQELADMAQKAGTEKPAADAEKKTEITDDMIKERFEKVTFRQIFTRPESYNQRQTDNIEAMKKTVKIEIVDPMMKAYSYVASQSEDEVKEYDKAIDAFKAIRETRARDLEKSKATLAEKEAASDKASETDLPKLLDEVSFATSEVTAGQENLAEVDYLICFYMTEKINDINTKRTKEFNDKQILNPDPSQTASVPDPSPEEQAMFDSMNSEMLVLMAEAVSTFETPNPYYNALYGDLLLKAKDWEKAHENWAIVADYGSRDSGLLQRAETAYNLFIDNLSPESRTKAGPEFDKLQQDLSKALEIQRKKQEEWQAQMQKMLEDQMAQEKK
jgi:hypothetical protein